MRRRRWIVSIGAVLLVGLGATLAIGVVKMNAANSEFQRLRASIAPPDGWVLASENTRLTGLFGTCFTSAFDVRACPSSLDEYAIEARPSEDQLATVLMASGASITATDCEQASADSASFGEICAVVGEKDGHLITISVNAGPNPDTTTDPWGRITIDR